MDVSVSEYFYGKDISHDGISSFDGYSWKRSLWTSYNSFFSYLEERLVILIAGVLSYFITSFLAYYLIVFFLKSNRGFIHHIRSCRRVLLITAHPDDECMFFGPVILQLIKESCNVYLLCLSQGVRNVNRKKISSVISSPGYFCNFDGKGALRKDELWKSCNILGIPESNIFLCRNSQLSDDPKMKWKKSVLSPIILSHIEIFQCDTVVTFDQSGVSGHVNHRAIFFSMCDIIDSNKLPSYCKVYFLETVNLLRKYSSFADTFLSFILSSCWYSVNFQESQQLKEAMKAHKSQFVWFRKLYLLFSRYVFINTLRASDSLDLCFDFED